MFEFDLFVFCSRGLPLSGNGGPRRTGQHAEDPGPHPHHHHRHVGSGRLPGRHLRRGPVLRLLAGQHDRQELIRPGEL